VARRSVWAMLAVSLLVGAGSTAVSAAPTPLPLSARLIKPGEFVFSPSGKPTRYASAKAWVGPPSFGFTAAQTAAETASLRIDGFKSTLLESLGSHAGISWVMELASPASARAALATTFHYSTLPVGGVKLLATFSDPAVPGSRGYEVSGHGSHGQNILFADGPFLYLLGDGWLNGSTNPPTRFALLAGLTRLYKRVHGHPAE